MGLDKKDSEKLHKNLDRTLDWNSSTKQNPNIGSTEPEAFLYLGNDRIYGEIRNSDQVLQQLDVYEKVSRCESLWEITCDCYEEGDIEREIGGYSVTPTQEILKTREVKLVGITDHCFVFALELYGENIWMISSSVSTDQAVVEEEVQKLRQKLRQVS